MHSVFNALSTRDRPLSGISFQKVHCLRCLTRGLSGDWGEHAVIEEVPIGLVLLPASCVKGVLLGDAHSCGGDMGRKQLGCEEEPAGR